MRDPTSLKQAENKIKQTAILTMKTNGNGPSKMQSTPNTQINES